MELVKENGWDKDKAEMISLWTAISIKCRRHDSPSKKDWVLLTDHWKQCGAQKNLEKESDAQIGDDLRISLRFFFVRDESRTLGG